MGKLTKTPKFDYLWLLQPKSGSFGGGCGGTEFPVMGRGERLAVTQAQTTFKVKPVS